MLGRQLEDREGTAVLWSSAEGLTTPVDLGVEAVAGRDGVGVGD